MRSRVRKQTALLLGAALGTGCHAAVGPVIAYRAGDGARIGWEAKGGHSVVSAAVGQAFSLGEGEDTVLHVAGEPGALIGATLGVDLTAGRDVGFMSGAWIGAPVYELESDRRYDVLGMQPLATVAFGYRYAHGHEVYLAPKYFLLERVRLAH